MKENGVDMSRVSISRSYAVLVGLEAYVKTRRKVKHGIGHAKDVETKVVHPEEHKRKVEEQTDNSESAKRERQILAQEERRLIVEKKEHSLPRRIWNKVSRGMPDKDKEKDKDKSRLSLKQREEAKEQKRKKALSKPGEDVEASIPPEGKRDGMN